MKLITLLLAVLVGSMLILSGCGKAPVLADETGATAGSVQATVDSNNAFAFDMLHHTEGNAFFSPWSLSVALAMTYEGAKGQTASEMRDVFHFINESRGPSYARILNWMNTKHAFKLNVANSVWTQEGYEFLPAYLSTLKTFYGATVESVDFGQSDESVKKINNWVEEETNGKIKNLLSSNDVDLLTRMVLTNAVYFKGDWVLEFDKSDTTDRDFRVSPTRTVKVPMMHLSGEKAKFNYYESDLHQAIELPYKGEELSMLIILPRDDSLDPAAGIDFEKLKDIRSNMHKTSVVVYLPKFKFDKKYSLAPILSDMGMPTAFSGNADFSGMDGTKDLFISKVIHQAFIDVDEKGTEAAAATAVVMTLNAAVGTTFNANHPFIFVIQDTETGNIIFMGRVTDPSRSS